MATESTGEAARAPALLDPRASGGGNSGPPRLIYLDVLRAAAILLVLGAHTREFNLPDNTFGHRFFDIWRNIGWVGVDLFFVLSGFLIGGLLFAEYRKYQGIYFGRFLIRRAFKIWPGYLALLAAVAIWDLKHNGSTAREALSHLWPYLLQIQNYLAPLVEDIGQTWSLAVEEHFYLLLPLLLAILILFHRRARSAIDAGPFRSLPWFCLGVAALCLGLRTWTWIKSPPFKAGEDTGALAIHWPTHLRIDSLLIGVTLSYATHFARTRIDALRRWRSVILLLSLVCFVPPVFFDYYSGFTCTIGYTLLAAGSAGLVLLAWFRGTDPEKRIANAAPMWIRILAMVGAYSYSIYLWHMPFVAPVVEKSRRHLHLWGSPFYYAAVTAVYIAISIGLGVLMFYLIEKPALRLRDRLFPSRSAAAPRSRSDIASEVTQASAAAPLQQALPPSM